MAYFIPNTTQDHLDIEDIRENNECNLEEAVRVALKRVTGAYCILLIDEDDPETIIAARKGRPLVIGVGKDLLISNNFIFE